MLNVMTLNLNYYVAKHGTWQERREIIRATIRSARPDIIALQAVEQEPLVEGGRDQAAQLAAELPEYCHVHYHPAIRTATDGSQGSAFLSRIPIAETQILPLTLVPNAEDPNQRVVLAARFDLASGPFYLCNAHFSWVAELARLNVQQTLPLIAKFDESGMLVGDLNNPPDNGILQPFRDAGWTDVWAALRPGEPGLTFESSQPTLRIDYGWANTASKPHLSGIKVIANQPNANGHRASDHFGLLIALDL